MPTRPVSRTLTLSVQVSADDLDRAVSDGYLQTEMVFKNEPISGARALLFLTSEAIQLLRSLVKGERPRPASQGAQPDPPLTGEESHSAAQSSQGVENGEEPE